MTVPSITTARRCERNHTLDDHKSQMWLQNNCLKVWWPLTYVRCRWQWHHEIQRLNSYHWTNIPMKNAKQPKCRSTATYRNSTTRSMPREFSCSDTWVMQQCHGNRDLWPTKHFFCPSPQQLHLITQREPGTDKKWFGAFILESAILLVHRLQTVTEWLRPAWQISAEIKDTYSNSNEMAKYFLPL